MNGTITPEKKYSAHINISSYHVDAQRMLKPSAFMDLAQEAAYQTSNLMHFGYEDLQKHHIVWVLSRMQMRFNRRPQWNEAVTLQTWCKGTLPLFFLRDFAMLDAEGHNIIEATTSWTVIDIASRKMVRGEEIDSLVSDEWICQDSVFDQPAGKVMVPRTLEMEQVAIHQVAYSDVDVVGHTNNTRYLAWAMDCLVYAYLDTHQLREVTINFNQECKPGDQVTISRCHDGDHHYIAGHTNAKQAFAIDMLFN